MATPGTLSAKAFRDPLLRVLGEKAGFQAGKDVAQKDLYSEIFSRMNITDIMAWGVTADAKVPWPERWIQFAFKDLVDKGLGSRMGKGRYALTPTGVQAALKLSAPNTPAGVVTTPPVAAQEPTVVSGASLDIDLVYEDPTDGTVDPTDGTMVTPAPAAPVPPPAPAIVHLSIPVGPRQPADPYHEDAYFRDLAVGSVTCLGAYSEQAAPCRGCGIRNSCLNAAAASLSRMAADLHTADQIRTAAVPRQAEPATPAPPAINADAFSWMLTARAAPIKIQVASQCPICKGHQTVQSDAVWCSTPGAGNARGGGLVHPSCYEQVTGKKAPQIPGA